MLNICGSKSSRTFRSLGHTFFPLSSVDDDISDLESSALRRKEFHNELRSSEHSDETVYHQSRIKCYGKFPRSLFFFSWLVSVITTAIGFIIVIYSLDESNGKELEIVLFLPERTPIILYSS